MIIGLVAITPAAGYVNGWGAIALGVIAATIVYFALNYLSRDAAVPQRRRHAGRDLHARVRRARGRPAGRRLRRPAHGAVLHYGKHGIVAGAAAAGVLFGNWTLLKWQAMAAVG